MSKFKVGDKVRCIDSTYGPVCFGDIVTIDLISSNHIRVVEHLSAGCAYRIDDFELVEEASTQPKFKPGDKVKYIGPNCWGFTKGNTYIVREYPRKWGSVRVEKDDTGFINGHCPDFFELVSSTSDLSEMSNEELLKIVEQGHVAQVVCVKRKCLEVKYANYGVWCLVDRDEGVEFRLKSKSTTFKLDEGWLVIIDADTVKIGCKSFNKSTLTLGLRRLIIDEGVSYALPEGRLSATKGGIVYDEFRLSWASVEQIMKASEGEK